MKKISETDHAAMKLAIEQALAEGGTVRQQVRDKLRDEPWLKVGEFCSYHRQCDTLELALWETAPCEIDDPDNPEIPPVGADMSRVAEAADLLRTMLAFGVSRWHPDPVAAVAAAKKPTRST
jgi:hypothetical protein